jgi:tetratricopeptide (TPR) repeat protein
MRWIQLVIAAGLVGCASTSRQTRQILKSPPEIPRQVQLTSVPFINQSAGYCGPATLAMAMQFAGKSIDMNELAPQVYTPGNKGTLQQDMISAIRRNGMMGVVIKDMPSLFTEVASGHPVIIFENLGLSWYPQWHYALVNGYDLDKAEVVMHSGPTPFERTRFKVFESSWAYSNYWGLVILRPGQLAKTGTELAHLNAAAGLEQSGHDDEAELAYQSILARWPQSLGALIGMGNVAYKHNDKKSAMKYLKLATEYHPESEAARHNLAIAEKMKAH